MGFDNKPDIALRIAWGQERVRRASLRGLARKVSKTRVVRDMGVKFFGIESGDVRAELQVTDRLKQPYGVLFGGILAALGDIVTALAGSNNVNLERYRVVTRSLSVHFIKPVSGGILIAKTVCNHRDERNQLWEVIITNESHDLVAVCQCALANIKKE